MVEPPGSRCQGKRSQDLSALRLHTRKQGPKPRSLFSRPCGCAGSFTLPKEVNNLSHMKNQRRKALWDDGQVPPLPRSKGPTALAGAPRRWAQSRPRPQRMPPIPVLGSRGGEPAGTSASRVPAFAFSPVPAPRGHATRSPWRRKSTGGWTASRPRRPSHRSRHPRPSRRQNARRGITSRRRGHHEGEHRLAGGGRVGPVDPWRLGTPFLLTEEASHLR